MNQATVSSKRLQCMANRMPEIQDTAAVGFALILGYHLRLDFTRTPYDVCNRRITQRQNRRDMLLEILEQRRILDDPVLDHLCQPGDPFSLRQRT